MHFFHTGTFQRIKISLLFTLISFSSIGQNFRGVVRYKYTDFNGEGKNILSPIETQDIFYNESHKLVRNVSGFVKDRVGNEDYYFDADKMVRYKINHNSRTIRNIGIENDVEVIHPLDYRKIGSAPVLNFLCDIYLLKYVHEFKINTATGQTETKDTLQCTIYSSIDLKMARAKDFAHIEGNRNSILLDGRFEGIILKVIRERKDHSKTVIEAINIEWKEMSEGTMLPKEYSKLY